MEYKVVNDLPCVNQFMKLRESVGWVNPSADIVEMSLANSVFITSVFSGSKLIGVGRIVGDGAMYFYLQDVVISPDYQGKGIGTLVMHELEKFISNKAQQGSTIALLAAYGKESFYEQFGYSKRTGEKLGFGMCKFIE